MQLKSDFSLPSDYALILSLNKSANTKASMQELTTADYIKHMCIDLQEQQKYVGIVLCL